ncbi:MAG: YbhN family protein [Halobacteriales archaeon]
MRETARALRPWLRFAGLLVIVAIAAAVFLDGFDLSGFLGRFAAAEPVYVAVAVVVYTVSWIPRGVRYRDILTRTGHACGTVAMTGAVFVSQTANLIFPARAGDGMRAYVVKKRNGVPYTTGAASLAAERVLDLAAVLALGAVGLVWTASVHGFEPTQGRGALVAASAAAAVTVAAVIVVYFLRGEKAMSVTVRGDEDGVFATVTDGVAGFIENLGAVFDDGEGVSRLTATSLVIWLLDVATAILLFYALGAASFSSAGGVFAVSLLAVSVGNLAKVVPATPGGVGLYEAGFAAVVVAATSVGWEVAVAVAVLDHAVKNAVTVVGGIVSALGLNVSLTSPAETDVDG